MERKLHRAETSYLLKTLNNYQLESDQKKNRMPSKFEMFSTAYLILWALSALGFESPLKKENSDRCKCLGNCSVPAVPLDRTLC